MFADVAFKTMQCRWKGAHIKSVVRGLAQPRTVNAVDKNEISPNQLFTLYTKGYNYSLNTEVKRAANQTVVDLMPTDKKSNYFKVRLFIDKTTNMIAKATLFEKSGVRYTYELKNIKTNTLKNNNLFAFNAAKYPGVEVIDLR